MEAGDRADRVGQVVEDEDEVRLDEARRRDADRVGVGQRDGRLEDRHRVVGEGADGAAGEARHALEREHPAPADERAQRGQRIGGRKPLDRQVGSIGVDAQRPGLDRRHPVADLEQAARPDAEEAVAARAARRPRPTRGGRPGRRRRAAGTPRSASRGRRRGSPAGGSCRRSPARRLRRGQAERIGCRHRSVRLRRRCGDPGPARRIKNDLRPRDERSCLPRCHPHSAICRTHLTDGSADGPQIRRPPIGAARYRWRSAPEPTGDRSRSVRRLPGPFPAVVAPVSTSHRVSVPTCDGYSSRSSPVLRDVGGSLGVARRRSSSARSAGRVDRRRPDAERPDPAAHDRQPGHGAGGLGGDQRAGAGARARSGSLREPPSRTPRRRGARPVPKPWP